MRKLTPEMPHPAAGFRDLLCRKSHGRIASFRMIRSKQQRKIHCVSCRNEAAVLLPVKEIFINGSAAVPVQPGKDLSLGSLKISRLIAFRFVFNQTARRPEIIQQNERTDLPAVNRHFPACASDQKLMGRRGFPQPPFNLIRCAERPSAVMRRKDEILRCPLFLYFLQDALLRFQNLFRRTVLGNLPLLRA